jgi:hypothetical protein
MHKSHEPVFSFVMGDLVKAKNDNLLFWETAGTVTIIPLNLSKYSEDHVGTLP